MGVRVETGMLSRTEFDEECAQLHRVSETCIAPNFDLKLNRKGTDVYLQIRKMVAGDEVNGELSEEAPGHELEEAFEETDESAVTSMHHDQEDILVEYSIVLSPTYRVPVLYFHMRHPSQGNLQSLEAVFQYVVPTSSTQRLRGIGVLGGISVTNHPFTDIPCFLVHPCNTAEAMKEIIASLALSSSHYLQIWIGLIGASVGLNLPIELAAKMEKS